MSKTVKRLLVVGAVSGVVFGTMYVYRTFGQAGIRKQEEEAVVKSTVPVKIEVVPDPPEPTLTPVSIKFAEESNSDEDDSDNATA